MRGGRARSAKRRSGHWAMISGLPVALVHRRSLLYVDIWIGSEAPIVKSGGATSWLYGRCSACPDVIPPSEWLPLVWGETGEANFPDQKTAEDTIGAVLARYNAVAEAMTRSRWIYPIYEVDPHSDEVMWEARVDGVTHAMRLRPGGWDRLLDQADEETRAAIIFLLALQDISTGQSKFADHEIDECDLEDPDLITNCLATISHQSRTEPCSCGSCRKYKKCCGRN